MTDLQKFIDAVAVDANLQSSLSESIDRNELAAKAVELGVERELIFSLEDVLNYIAGNTSEVELNDIELDRVVGGVGVDTISKDCPS